MSNKGIVSNKPAGPGSLAAGLQAAPGEHDAVGTHPDRFADGAIGVAAFPQLDDHLVALVRRQVGVVVVAHRNSSIFGISRRFSRDLGIDPENLRNYPGQRASELSLNLPNARDTG